MILDNQAFLQRKLRSQIFRYSEIKMDLTMVSIILLNWNGKRFLQDCIQSVCAQSYRNYELISIDNCSTDGSQEFLLQQDNLDQLFLNEVNLGYCGGSNLGIRKTTGEYVLILNPDVILHSDFLAHILEVVEYDPSIGIATGKLLRFDRKTLDSTGQFLRSDLSPLERGYGEPDTGQYDQPGSVFSSCGAVAFYRRAMLEDIQLDGEFFDESYFAFYEDLDLGWRAQLLGWKAYYIPTAVAYHYRGGGLTELKQPESWFERIPFFPTVSLIKKPVALQRHIIRNRYLTLIKNASSHDILRGLPAILKFELLLWGYVVCMRPSLLTTLFDLVKRIPEARKKRHCIRARRNVRK
jgi:GT2 family glycosyltransferase